MTPLDGLWALLPWALTVVFLVGVAIAAFKGGAIIMDGWEKRRQIKEEYARFKLKDRLKAENEDFEKALAMRHKALPAAPSKVVKPPLKWKNADAGDPEEFEYTEA